MRRPQILLILLLLPSPALAAEEVVHEDFRRAFPDDASVRAAGQRVLDYSEFAVGDAIAVRDQRLRLYSLLFGGYGHEHEWLALARQEAAGMKEAMERNAGTYPIPEILRDLEPPSRNLGRNLVGLINGLANVAAEDQSLLERILEVRDVEQKARESLQILGRFDQLGYDTSRLRYLLGLILAATTRLNIDPALLATPGGAGGEGGQGMSRVLVEPDPAYFGQEVRVLVVDPERKGSTVLVTTMGLNATAELDAAGVAVVYFDVPWSASLGEQPVAITWSDRQAGTSLQVSRVPTLWESTKASIVGNTTMVTATLIDAHEARVGPAPVAWSTADAEGAGETSAQGTVLVEVPGLAPLGTLSFAGNRTHAPAEATWDISRSLEDLGLGRTPGSGEGGGVAAGYSGWGLPSNQLIFLWLMVLLGLVLVGLVAAAARGRAVTRWEPAAVAEPAAETRAPAPLPASEPQLAPNHPLLRVLERAGFQSQALTLREAEPLWQALGAPPRLSTWLHRFEAAYYTERPQPPIPGEVLVWARRA